MAKQKIFVHHKNLYYRADVLRRAKIYKYGKIITKHEKNTTEIYINKKT